MKLNNFIEKFWQFLTAISVFFAGLFYFLLKQEKTTNNKNKINFAEKEAKAEAKERNEKVKNDNVATANDITSMLVS
jgi:ATP-dependent Zn protease